jgi:hypothetical protein
MRYAKKSNRPYKRLPIDGIFQMPHIAFKIWLFYFRYQRGAGDGDRAFFGVGGDRRAAELLNLDEATVYEWRIWLTEHGRDEKTGAFAPRVKVTWLTEVIRARRDPETGQHMPAEYHVNIPPTRFFKKFWCDVDAIFKMDSAAFKVWIFIYAKTRGTIFPAYPKRFIRNKCRMNKRTFNGDAATGKKGVWELLLKFGWLIPQGEKISLGAVRQSYKAELGRLWRKKDGREENDPTKARRVKEQKLLKSKQALLLDIAKRDGQDGQKDGGKL